MVGLVHSAVMRHRVCLQAALLAVTLGWLVPGSAQAQAQTTQPPDTPVAQAPVVVDGVTLFSVRGITAFPAERRASEISAAIRRLARDSSIGPSSLTLTEQPTDISILANGQRLMRVFDEDAALESVDRRTLAEGIRGSVITAIERYREDRRPAVLIRYTLLALGATLLLVAGALAGRWVIKRIQASIQGRFQHRVKDIGIQSFRVLRAEQLWSAVSGVLGFAWGLSLAAAFFVYLRYVLGEFPWTRGVANNLSEMVLGPVGQIGSSFLASLPNLFFLAILFVITRYGVKMLRLFFDSVASGAVHLRNFESEWAAPTYKLTRLAIVAFAVAVAYPYIPGSNTDAFKGVTLFIGVIFSLGSSSLIGNIISGYTMTYRRTFHVGDVVQINQYLGEVVEMRMLVTHLRTPKNEEVIVPTSSIVGGEVVNYSSMARTRGLILHTNVGIGYETPWRQVEAMLIEAAGRTEGLLKNPPPFVNQTALGDFAVTYEINVHCDAPIRMREFYSRLHRNILDVFNEYGVQIMTPAYEGDPEVPKIVPKEQMYTAPARPPVEHERV
jgi:small-conductance mechanosensitive channel